MKYRDAQGNITEVGSPDLNPELIAGKTLVSDATTLSAPSFISSANLSSVGSPVIPPAPQDTTNYGGIISGAATYVTPSGASSPEGTPDTPYTNKAGDLTARIEALMGSLGGKTSYEQQQLGTSGATALDARQRELSAQMTALTNESQAIPLRIQEEFKGTGATTGGVAPIQTGELRRNAIKALSINSEYALNAGQLQTAKENAQRAVDLKYKDTEDKIDQQTKLLALYTPFMNAEEKKRADAVAAQNETRKTELADRKKQQTDVINAAQTNGDAATASAVLKLDPNSSTFTQDLAVLQSGMKQKEATPNTQVVEVGGRKVLIDSATGEPIKDLGVSTTEQINLTPSNKTELLGVGFTSSDITNIQNDINAHGIGATLEGITDTKQKQAIQKIYGEGTTKLTRENVAKLYGLTDDETKTGFLGFGKTNKTKLDDIMKIIEQYQAVGQSDAEILKLIKK